MQLFSQMIVTHTVLLIEIRVNNKISLNIDTPLKNFFSHAIFLPLNYNINIQRRETFYVGTMINKKIQYDLE